jgi:hypothetical protein
MRADVGWVPGPPGPSPIAAGVALSASRFERFCPRHGPQIGTQLRGIGRDQGHCCDTELVGIGHVLVRKVTQRYCLGWPLAHSKTVVRVTVPWVRIPPSPRVKLGYQVEGIGKSAGTTHILPPISPSQPTQP